MAGRVFQRCVRDVPHLKLTHIQVATKMTNPLKKRKKVKVDTTFTEKSEKLTLRSQKKPQRSPEEDVQYRRAEIVSNMVGSVTIKFGKRVRSVCVCGEDGGSLTEV